MKQDIIFSSHAYLMLTSLWQTCCSASETCREKTENSAWCVGAQPTPTLAGDPPSAIGNEMGTTPCPERRHAARSRGLPVHACPDLTSRVSWGTSKDIWQAPKCSSIQSPCRQRLQLGTELRHEGCSRWRHQAEVQWSPGRRGMATTLPWDGNPAL